MTKSYCVYFVCDVYICPFGQCWWSLFWGFENKMMISLSRRYTDCVLMVPITPEIISPNSALQTSREADISNHSALSPKWHNAKCSFHSLGRKLFTLSSGHSSFWCRLKYNSAILTLWRFVAFSPRPNQHRVLHSKSPTSAAERTSFALHLHWWCAPSFLKGFAFVFLFPDRLIILCFLFIAIAIIRCPLVPCFV